MQINYVATLRNRFLLSGSGGNVKCIIYTNIIVYISAYYTREGVVYTTLTTHLKGDISYLTVLILFYTLWVWKAWNSK